MRTPIEKDPQVRTTPYWAGLRAKQGEACFMHAHSFLLYDVFRDCTTLHCDGMSHQSADVNHLNLYAAETDSVSRLP